MARSAAREDAPWLRPYPVYSQGANGTLSYTVAKPASSSRVAHYQFAPNGSWCLRRVLSADGTEVLFKEVVELGEHPRCSCGNPSHAEFASEKLAALRQTSERRLPPEALRDLEREMRSQPGPRVDDGEYDGGYVPGGIGWFTDDGQPADGNRIEWGVDVPRDNTKAGAGSAPTRFLMTLTGSVTDEVAALAPIVERTLLRTITHPPRLAGDWDDLFQEGMITALQEARKLSAASGESPDRFAARLARRVALAVKHRLIDLVRRQDAATRNMPASSLEAGQEAGIDIPASDTDPFDLLFRLPEDRQHRARFMAVALDVYREARGLARKIIRRAYLAALVGRCSRGTGELRTDPEYPAASRWLAQAWATSTARAMQGAVQPVFHRRRKRLTASAA